MSGVWELPGGWQPTVGTVLPFGYCGSTKSGIHVMADNQICEACGEPYAVAEITDLPPDID